MFQRLIEKMELHNELNPKLWDGNKLRPEVEDKIEDIIDQFIIELQENEIPIKILDVRLVGSNASFNYTENSDLDIHIIANFEDTSCDVPVLNLLYNFFKKNFNDKYDISIHGVPIELYVEDVNSSAVSNGVYSIFGRKWVKFPEPIEVPDIDITDIFAPYEERYNEIIEHKNAEAASTLIDDLYLLRKDSISTDGEYGEGNLVFKEFRNKGYLDNLKQLLVDETSKELSLESLKENLNNIDKDKIFDFIENNFHQSRYPDIGPGYILPDGYFLVLRDIGAHIGVDEVLFENELISEDPYSYNYPYPNLILVDEFNAIRYNDGENLGDEYGNPYIQLPKKKPTYEQFDSLESWIDDLDFDKKLFVNEVEYDLGEVDSSYIINKIKKYYTTGVLQENLILEDKESQKLFQAFQHYLGTRRERISNPSGSGINKGENIQDAKHHNDNAHGEERADDIEIKNFRKHSSDHYKAFRNAFNQFMEEVKKLLPNINNTDLTMLINKISDEASAKMFKDKLDAIADKYEQYSDKLDDLKSLLGDIRARYRNNEFDVKLTESRNHMDFEEMVEQAAVRHPKPEDIFEKPWDKLVDPKTFFDKLTSNASKEYKTNTRKRIAKTDSTQPFYKTILGYLDSLSINKEYPKLEPASYQIKMGEFVPVDGRHRAQLCLMLGMPLPVKEVKSNKLEESKHGNFNTLAYHGSDAKFDKFDLSKAGTHDAGQWGKGIYFTNKKEIASNFGGKYIYTCRINLKNPYYVENEDDIADYIALAEDNNQVTEILKEQGYDGVISRNETWYNPQDIMSPLIADQYVVFDPKDIQIIDVQELGTTDELTEDIEDDSNGDWGYHYGDLGNKSDRRGNFGGRNSGGFGTGTYFVGTPISQRDDGGPYKNRPEHKVDFSKYHLFRPRTNEEAYRLHDALLTFNNMEGEFKEEFPTSDQILTEYENMMDKVWAEYNTLDPDDFETPTTVNTKPLLQYIRKYINLLPYKISSVEYDDLYDAARTIEDSLLNDANEFQKALWNLSSALHYYNEDKLRKIVVAALKDKSDKAPSTLIMQSLGYDGIDVRHLNHDAQGLSGLDNFGFGSVIYDLKEGIEETNKASIKAIIFTTDENPKKDIPPFKDFAIDGIYSLGENTYIAFEKRWKDDPRGISFIHADVADDYILPYFPNYAENTQTQDTYIEMDNFQFPNISTNIDELKDGKYSKYYSPILQEINKWFR